MKHTSAAPRGNSLGLKLAIILTLIPATQAQAVTLEEIAEVYRQRQEALGTFLVVYTQTTTTTNVDGSAESHASTVRLLTDGRRFRKEDDFLGAQFGNSIQSNDLTEYRTFSPGGRGFGRIAPALLPSQVLDQIGLNPLWLGGLVDSPGHWSQGGLAIDLRGMVMNPSHRLLEQPLELDGQQTLVLEHVIDMPTGPVVWTRTWVSADERLVLLRQEHYREDDVNYRVENFDYYEAAQGLFVPRRSKIAFLRSNLSHLSQEVSFTLESLDVHYPASDSDFTIVFPPGAYVHTDPGILLRRAAPWIIAACATFVLAIIALTVFLLRRRRKQKPEAILLRTE